MLIMNQKRNVLLNLDNITSIQLNILGDGNTNEIYATLMDECPETLGIYNIESRAKEIFNKIAEIQGGTSTYYMPEE